MQQRRQELGRVDRLVAGRGEINTIHQAWDFRPGNNFVLRMDGAYKEAERTIAVLSPDFLSSSFAPSEWAIALKKDPTSEKGLIVPVRVRKCELDGLL
jgi:hypothetical protein